MKKKTKKKNNNNKKNKNKKKEKHHLKNRGKHSTTKTNIKEIKKMI